MIILEIPIQVFPLETESRINDMQGTYKSRIEVVEIAAVEKLKELNTLIQAGYEKFSEQLIQRGSVQYQRFILFNPAQFDYEYDVVVYDFSLPEQGFYISDGWQRVGMIEKDFKFYYIFRRPKLSNEVTAHDQN